MNTYTKDQIGAIIKSHGEWLTGRPGARANLLASAGQEVKDE